MGGSAHSGQRWSGDINEQSGGDRRSGEWAQRLWQLCAMNGTAPIMGHRVLVDGMMGSGKTRSHVRSRTTGLPLIHLDVHYWNPGWARPSDDEWRARQRTLLAGEAWIIDGNYNETLALRLQRVRKPSSCSILLGGGARSRVRAGSAYAGRPDARGLRGLAPPTPARRVGRRRADLAQPPYRTCVRTLGDQRGTGRTRRCTCSVRGGRRARCSRPSAARAGLSPGRIRHSLHSPPGGAGLLEKSAHEQVHPHRPGRGSRHDDPHRRRTRHRDPRDRRLLRIGIGRRPRRLASPSGSRCCARRTRSAPSRGATSTPRSRSASGPSRRPTARTCRSTSAARSSAASLGALVIFVIANGDRRVQRARRPRLRVERVRRPLAGRLPDRLGDPRRDRVHRALHLRHREHQPEVDAAPASPASPSASCSRSSTSSRSRSTTPR